MEREAVSRRTSSSNRVQVDFDVEKILREIETSAEFPDGFTTQELSDVTGRSVSWCRTTLRKLINAGKAKMVGKRTTLSIDGKRYPTPVYNLIDL